MAREITVQLVAPTPRFKKSFLAALDEFPEDEEAVITERRLGKADFERYVGQVDSWSRGEDLPAGWIPATTRWLVDGADYIGTTNIRHQLTDFLRRYGGHIGYSIRPSKRLMGYGTEICRLALDEARRVGLVRVLITCDDDNVGSRRIIEHNGGVLENVVPQPDRDVHKRRYWVDL